VDDVPVGYAVYAPDAFVPGAASFPTAPVSPDAVLLTMIHVEPAFRGGGLARMLVQGMASDLAQRGRIGAIEAFGDPSGRGGRCLLPVEFLGSVGFKTHRPHPTAPRMRMDLRAAISWKDEVETAFGRLVGAMRPKSARGPAPKATRASRWS
jgi:GNAT superfamily N-acetyltransferase